MKEFRHEFSKRRRRHDLIVPSACLRACSCSVRLRAHTSAHSLSPCGAFRLPSCFYFLQIEELIQNGNLARMVFFLRSCGAIAGLVMSMCRISRLAGGQGTVCISQRSQIQTCFRYTQAVVRLVFSSLYIPCSRACVCTITYMTGGQHFQGQRARPVANEH